MQSNRILAIAAGWVIAVFGIPVTAPAQTIDTSAARATVGTPLNLTVRVRDFEPGPAALGRDCLQADVQQGDTATPAQPLRWLSSVRTGDGETWVTLTSVKPIDEPILRIKVALLCGASFTREFTLLAEPPAPRQPGQAIPPSSRRATRPESRTQTEAAPPSAAARPAAAQGLMDALATASPLSPGAAIAATNGTAISITEPSASPLTDAFVQLWQQDMQSVREELRQSRAAQASMGARLERSERDTWQLWGGLAASAAGLVMISVLMRLARELRLRRFVRMEHGMAQPTKGRADGRPDDRLEPPMAAHADTPAVTPQPAEPATATAQPETPVAATPDRAQAIDWDVPQDNAPSRWSQADFGQPDLDEMRHAELLSKVDAITADGYYGASVAVLENALQSRVGKCAGILLRLLDLYRLLNQPWNHERVTAEIEAIYNVQVPPIEQSAEGRNLDEHERTWQQVASIWGTPQASEQLAQWLVRPTRIEVLDLAGFRDALLLHAMSLQREAPAPPARAADSAAADSHELPALPWFVLEAVD